MGGGAGTVIEYVEVIAGQDDGFEWFGGTVNTKYFFLHITTTLSTMTKVSGLGQFWAAVMADNGSDGDKGEFDGDDSTGQSKVTPIATPVIYNMTVIGTGHDVKPNDGGTIKYKNGGGQIDYEEEAGGSFNSIIVATGDNALDINSSTVDNVNAGLLQVRNNIFFQDLAKHLQTLQQPHGTLPL